MLKCVNTYIVCLDYAAAIALSIHILVCPCHCPGCHSSFLAADKGEMLTCEVVEKLIEEADSSISCIGFMGGDADPACINMLASHVRTKFPKLKVGWYSGRTMIASDIQLYNCDYIKIGPYLKHLGGLKSKRTNQKMFNINSSGEMIDITYRFQV